MPSGRAHRAGLDEAGSTPRAVDAKAATTPETRLKALDSNKRAALLLTAVEAFSLEEAAFILDETADDVERAIVNAQQTIDRDLASRVLIIGGRADHRARPREPRHRTRDTMVVATAATRDEAVAKALRNVRPGAGRHQSRRRRSGIDAVAEILNSFDIPVIFITAYPEKLLTGERPEPTYLIAKPFLPETVQATVGQALFFHPNTRKAA